LFITATYNPDESGENNERPLPVSSLKDFESYFKDFRWNLERDLPLEGSVAGYEMSAIDKTTLAIWQDFLERFLSQSGGTKLPGFPLWSDFWQLQAPLDLDQLPDWKRKFVEKNRLFYVANQNWIDAWRADNPNFERLPNSRRKFEWQAGDLVTLEECAVQFRPSGVRVKSLTHLPALVAITQTSILPKYGRRITPQEAARLQGFPDFFDFGDQGDQATYKQMGNSVNIGVVSYVFAKHIERDSDVLSKTPEGRKLITAVANYKGNPDAYYESCDSMESLLMSCRNTTTQ
jgi:DNA (cytosine-5)-methyltransferase 1